MQLISQDVLEAPDLNLIIASPDSVIAPPDLHKLFLPLGSGLLASWSKLVPGITIAMAVNCRSTARILESCKYLTFLVEVISVA